MSTASRSAGTDAPTCDHCGSDDVEWVKCKLICRSCRQIVKSCADLSGPTSAG